MDMYTEVKRLIETASNNGGQTLQSALNDLVDAVKNVTIDLKLDFDDAFNDPPDDCDESMDGDHESGLASAGWGTDEDYGCFDGGDDY